MTFAFKPIVLAAAVAAAQVAGAAHALTQSAPVAANAQSAAAANAPTPTRAPDDWIVYEDRTYTPVVDTVSRHLDAARKALDAKDNATAAAELRVVAGELRLQAARAALADRALVRTDKALAAADARHGQDTVNRLNASARKVGSAAVAIEHGQVKTTADLDKAIDRAVRADMERRWAVTDVSDWYRVSEEPQRHFTDAVTAYAGKEYETAATDIRKAASYLRLEASRATGDAKQELDGSIAQLEALAASVQKGTGRDEQSMARVFAKADHALALQHRSKAAESWARNEYERAGYELKAAAHALESAAGWIGGAAKAGVSATVEDVRSLGNELATGGNWTRAEVARDFASLGNGIDATGKHVDGARAASPI